MRNKAATRTRPAVSGSTALWTLALLAAAGTLHAQSPVELVREGRLALVDNEPLLAVEYFREAADLNPSYFDAFFGLAEAFYLLDEYDEALVHVRRAGRLTRRNPDVLVLEARILLGLGNLEEARAMLNQARAVAPNSADTRRTQAEIALAEGQVEAAEAELLEAYRLDPSSRRTLLSLMILYDTTGRPEAAGAYLQLALRAFPDNALVQYLAATHHLGTDELEQAMSHVQTAVSLEPEYRDALLLQAALYYHRREYAQAEAVTEQLLLADIADTEAWYIRSIAQVAQGRIDDALLGFRRLLRATPDFELGRLAMESTILENLDLEDERREEPARYRFGRAEVSARQNLFGRALLNYRRGLRLDPYSQDGRLAYAELFRTTGHFATFLAEVSVLSDLGANSTRISDIIEIYESLLVDSVSSEWGIDQFSITRNPLSIALFYEDSGFSLGLPDSSRVIADFAADLLLGREHLTPSGPAMPAPDYSAAFRSARLAGADYFVVFRFEDRDRSFSGEARVYLTRTGGELARFATARSGNERIQGVVTTLVEQIANLAPVAAPIVERELSRAVVALGSLDGIEEGDVFPIVAETDYLLARDGVSFLYSEANVRGTLEITRTDDLVSEGRIESAEMFDTVGVGDLVLAGGQGPDTAGQATLFPPIYHRIRSIR